MPNWGKMGGQAQRTERWAGSYAMTNQRRNQEAKASDDDTRWKRKQQQAR